MSLPFEPTLAGIIAFSTMAIAILIKVVGFPDQVRKNYLRKSTEGISTVFFILAFVSYSLWTLHGIMQHDNVLILGMGTGILTTGIILGQIIAYRKK